VDLYSALFVVPHTQGALQTWITQFCLQLHQLPHKCSPDGASTKRCGGI